MDRSETLVLDLLLATSIIGGDDFHRERIVEIGGWIVEGKMSVHANPQQAMSIVAALSFAA